MWGWWVKSFAILFLVLALPSAHRVKSLPNFLQSAKSPCSHSVASHVVLAGNEDSPFLGLKDKNGEEAVSSDSTDINRAWLGFSPTAVRWIVPSSGDIVLSLWQRCGRLFNLPPPSHA